MNDLFPNSLKQYQDLKTQAYIDVMEVSVSVENETIDIDKFFHDVDNVKDDIMVVEKLYKKVQESNEERKMVQDAKRMKLLRSKMDSDFTHLLKIVKIVKGKLEALHKSNVKLRKIPRCGPDSSFNRTHASVVIDLGEKFKIMMGDFQKLLTEINDEYKETIKRTYIVVTGEKANEEIIDNLISSGDDEDFLRKAFYDQGHGQTMDTISEVQERIDAIVQIKKNLSELLKLFLDMVIQLETQGQKTDDIESDHEANTTSFVAKKLRKRWRTCACITVILAVIILVLYFVVIPLPYWYK